MKRLAQQSSSHTNEEEACPAVCVDGLASSIRSSSYCFPPIHMFHPGRRPWPGKKKVDDSPLRSLFSSKEEDMLYCLLPFGQPPLSLSCVTYCAAFYTAPGLYLYIFLSLPLVSQ